MKSTDYKTKKEELLTELDGIVALYEKEDRDISEDEATRSDEILAEVKELNTKIESAEARESALKERAKKAVKKDTRSGETKELDQVSEKFSLGKACQDMLAGRDLSGANAEMAEEGKAELALSGMSPKGFPIPRSVLDRVETRTDIDQNTSGIQSTDLDGYARAIRAQAVYNRVGINFRRAVGDVKTNIVTAMNWAWVAAENTAATDIGQNFTSVTGAPTWCRGYVDVSKTLLAQNPDAMNEIMFDLGVAEANVFDTALFSTASVSNAPASIAATSNVLTFTEASYSANASVYSDFIEAIQTLGENNAYTDNMKFVTNPILFKEIYQSAQVLAVQAGIAGRTYTGQTIGGHDAIFTTATTSATTSGDTIAGDFSTGVKAYQWGGLDLFLDPYTVALNDQVRVIGHKRVEWVVPQGARFVKFTSPTA